MLYTPPTPKGEIDPQRRLSGYSEGLRAKQFPLQGVRGQQGKAL
jgi:hypothetical protein